LDECGVGRPSTFSQTVSRIQEHGLILKKKGSLHATEIGEIVHDRLVQFFGDIVDPELTAKLEEGFGCCRAG
jgi:DNA topoisomerase-1